MHINLINNKRYIGITGREVRERWMSGSGYKTGSFCNAIRKHGWQNFNHIILQDGLTELEANEKEIYYINLFKTRDRKFGYNIHVGGNVKTGYLHTKEAKEKISESARNISEETRIKKKIARSKQVITEQHKENISKSRIGIKFSSEHISNLSKSHIGNEYYWKGKQRTQETKEKIKEKLSIKVICFNTKNVYNSIAEAAKLTSVPISTIQKRCNGAKPRKKDALLFEYFKESRCF